MKLFVAFVAVLVSVSASTDREQWKDFKLKFGKVYGRSFEEQTRFSIFSNNLRTIEAHNAKFDNGETSWKMGVNQFADLTPSEFRATLTSTLNSSKLPETDGPVGVFLEPTKAVPKSIDWRTKGAVTPVKNQGTCGGCWSFSATGTLESIYYIQTGHLLSLSEQNLLDCASESEYGCWGCQGGVVQRGLLYIRDHGIQLEHDYPYRAVEGSCQYTPSKKALTIKGFINVGFSDEDTLRAAVGTIGPISVALNADMFQFYSSGVFDDTSCPTTVNHAVLAVGYTSDYWIIKNSWGTGFGEHGYIRMKYGKNICNLTAQPCYPSL